MKKIDTHLHVNFLGLDAEGILDYMNSKNIEKCWLLTWEEKHPAFKSLYKNLTIEEILDIYEKYPDRIVPFYAPDPGRSDWKRIMKYYHLKGVEGCGELKVTYKWLDDEIKKVLDGLKELNMPVIFHMEESNYHFFIKQNNFLNNMLYKLLNGAFNGITRKYAEQFIDKTGLFKERFQKRLHYFPGYMMDFTGLEYRLEQYPDINFIAHGPAFWNNIEKNPDPYLNIGKGKIKSKGISVQLLEKYDNLYADTSGKSGFHALKRDRDFTKKFLDKFCEKILFGTDNQYQLPFEDLIRNAKIPKKKLRRIMRENAATLCE